MRVLLLSPADYTIHTSVTIGFERLGHSVYHYNYRKDNKKWEGKFNVHSRRLPFAYRSKWNNYFFKKINQNHRAVFDKQIPDIVFVYNNEMLLPETVAYFKKKGAKIIFFMGDNPYYTNTSDYYLSLLFKADLIIAPDSFWLSQLNLLGIKNTMLEFFHLNIDPQINQSLKGQQVPKHDLLFIGMGYSHSWGYKRTLFVSKFSSLDIRVHGDKLWLRWLEFFPELKEKFILKQNRYGHEYMTALYLNAKIYPVDANPGLLNGMHVRIFDCLNYNLLPLPEYRKDIETIFKDMHLPIIKDYNKAASLAQYFLDHENERIDLIKSLKNFIDIKFSPEVSFKRILDKL